jgi:hypothetical protein
MVEVCSGLFRAAREAERDGAARPDDAREAADDTGRGMDALPRRGGALQNFQA